MHFLNFYPVSTSDQRAAWLAFASSAAEFGAPVPDELLTRIQNGAEIPSTLEEIRALLTACETAADHGDEFGVSSIGVAGPEEIEDADSRLVARLRFGTGRTQAIMDIWAPIECEGSVYWVWAEGRMDGPCNEPAQFASLADSLARRWRAIRQYLPVSTGETVEVFTRGER